MKHSLLALAASATLALSANAQSTIILNEDFTAPSRFTQNPPSTTAWYTSGAASDITYQGNGNLTANSAAANTLLITYFTNSGTVNLAPGSSLKLDFKISLDGITSAAGGIRLGLFNSGGNRISADGLGTAPSNYNGYTGYAAYFNPGGATVNAGTIRKRDKAHNSLINGNNAYTNLGSGGELSALSNNTVYNGTLLLNYTPEGSMTLTFSINGMELTLADNVTGGAFTSFDTFAITSMVGSSTSITLEELTITYNAIPESGTTGLGIAAIALLSLLCRYRKSFRRC